MSSREELRDFLRARRARVLRRTWVVDLSAQHMRSLAQAFTSGSTPGLRYPEPMIAGLER